MMTNTTTPVAKLGTSVAERLLEAAGIEFTPVPRCPVADCPVCARAGLRVAA